MASNPWGNNDSDTSFEQGSPIQKGAKNVAKATTSQLQQQQKAFTKALNDQLYGPTPEMPQKDEKKEVAPGMETIQKQLGQTNPGDEKQLEETRKKLQEFQKQHKEYFEKTMGEEARNRIKNEEKQKEEAKLQEERDAAEQAERKRAAQEQNLGGVAPQGKSTGPGRQRMQKPIALEQAKTKTEINRGTTG